VQKRPTTSRIAFAYGRRSSWSLARIACVARATQGTPTTAIRRYFRVTTASFKEARSGTHQE